MHGRRLGSGSGMGYWGSMFYVYTAVTMERWGEKYYMGRKLLLPASGGYKPACLPVALTAQHDFGGGVC